jgi:predicted amidohydrolase YtcJ
MRGAYAWRTVIDAGAVFVAGSDFPVESHDPRRGLFAAVARRPAGQDADWSPEERLGREEALAAFTVAPAYVSGDLHRLGTLAPGKRADLAVFDRNLVTCDPESLLAARPLLTLRDGRVTWRDPEADLPGMEEVR